MTAKVRNVVGEGVVSPAAINCHFEEKCEKKYLLCHVPCVDMLSCYQIMIDWVKNMF